ncbi:MAG: hypothetical protein IKL49_12165 [Lachnospiraceae bacterium]|nr:hypothetical protein [Lachnospiraceae bacterium]
MSENNMTKSQAKRKARLEENKKAKREASRTKLTTNLIIVLVVALFAAGIGSYVYYRMTTTQASSDYSAYLNEDGTLKGINPADHITPIDYQNIVVPKSEIEFTEEEMESTIDSLLTTYEATEFTDEFVAENLSEVATTVEEYKEYLKTSKEQTALQNYLINYISANASATTVDEGHLKYLKGISKFEQETYYNSYNQTMMLYTGAPAYTSFSEYTGMSNKEFETYLDVQCRIRAAADMTYQYIFTELGLSVEDSDYEATVTAMGTNALSGYGKNYIMQMTMQNMVISYLCENVTIQ